MRYLLLSVLAVCVIGVMVPSVFAEVKNSYTDPENRFSIDYPLDWIHTTGDNFDVGFTEKIDDHTHIIIMHFPSSGLERDVGYLNYVKLFAETRCDIQTYEESGQICSNYDVKETKTLDIDINRKAFLVKDSWQITYSHSTMSIHPYTSQTLVIPTEDYHWIIYIQCEEYCSPSIDDVFLQMIKSFRLPALEPVAEPEPVTYTTDETGADTSSLTDYDNFDQGSKFLYDRPITYTLPPGVKSPAPNFENNFKDEFRGVPYTYFDGEDGLTIGELYSYWTDEVGAEWDPGFIKIISGDGKDLLVWYATLDCSGCSRADEVSPQNFEMYDGEDRKFTIVTSSLGRGIAGMIENPNFSWSETCSPLPVTVQPGVIDKIELCFEIPKNSDHFKFIESSYGGYGDIPKTYASVWALFDRSVIGNTASNAGGCLIATAAFGSEMAPQVQFLRELRDNTVLQTESGSAFMTGFNQFYYSFSPAVADYERENPAFKEAVKITLTPLLASLTLLQYADIDSESEMLGYGIGVILLNIGMYFVAPAVLIMAVRKRI